VPFQYTFRADDLESIKSDDRDLLENRDRELELYLNPPYLSIARVATQAYTNGTTANIQFDTEYVDTVGFITPTSENITVPIGAGGLYAVAWTVTWDVSGTAKTATLYINSIPIQPASSSTGTVIAYHANVILAASDVVTLRCTNTAGATRNATATLRMVRLMA
jgi:hypothetical protein